MIRVHPADPPLTGREAAEIARMTALAVVRGGTYTTAQQRRIDRILDTARTRAAQAADQK